MKNICIAIRVYSRISDLECLVHIINDTWYSNKYDIYIMSNGEKNGYQVPKLITNTYQLISLTENAGHMSGSSQLLLALWDSVDLNKYEYCVILEADTWIYGDELINKYTDALENNDNAVYAAAKWYDKYHSLATDFAIIKCSFLVNNRELFVFNDKAECHMANFIIDSDKNYILIKENMLPNLPNYLKYYPYSDNGRLCCFPFSKMVTHHIENLSNGIETKKRLFNDIIGKPYFKKYKPSWIRRFLMFFFFFVSKLLLRKTWYSSTIRLKE